MWSGGASRWPICRAAPNYVAMRQGSTCAGAETTRCCSELPMLSAFEPYRSSALRRCHRHGGRQDVLDLLSDRRAKHFDLAEIVKPRREKYFVFSEQKIRSM